MQLFVITADDRRGGAIHVRLHASALSPPPPYSQQYHVRLTLHHVRQVADGASVAVLRETLAEREGIPACEMCLMANGRQLAEDRRRVEDYSLGHGSTISILLRVRTLPPLSPPNPSCSPTPTALARARRWGHRLPAPRG